MSIKHVSSFDDLPLPRLKQALSFYEPKLREIYIAEKKKRDGANGVMYISLKDNTFDCAYYTLKDVPDKADDMVKALISNSTDLLFMAQENGKVVTFSLPKEPQQKINQSGNQPKKGAE